MLVCVRVQGRGRAQNDSKKEHPESEVPVLSWDYGFLGGKAGDSNECDDETDGVADGADDDRSGQSPVLVMRDRCSQTPLWYLLQRKGCDYQLFSNFLKIVCQDLDRLGYNCVHFRSDGEPALVTVLDQIKAHWSGEVIVDHSAEGDSASNGNGECGVGHMKGHTRSIKFDFESDTTTNA